MTNGILERIRAAFREDRFQIGPHVLEEAARDGVSLEEIVAAIGSGEAEIIEDYSEDRRGHSCLILTRVRHRPLHVVCTALVPVFIITCYVPNAKRWFPDWRTRRPRRR